MYRLSQVLLKSKNTIKTPKTKKLINLRRYYSSKKSNNIKLPNRVNLSQLKPIKHGKGSIIDTQAKTPESPSPILKPTDYVPMDGNTAAAYVAYANSEVSFIYPISPATSMGEQMDLLRAAGKKSIINNQPVRVEVMQSEGGAAGACHGALAAGALTSTFTASQGLLLMIPNLYLIAGELMPTVFHISARTVAKQALCIYNDHSDVMGVRQCGWSILSSNTPQEVLDLGLVSHLTTVKSRVPFLHFFDGNRTSHEINKIHKIPYNDMELILRKDLIDKNLRQWALNPVNPISRGTGQRPDIFFQNNMISERYYLNVPHLLDETMAEVESITGRKYNLYDYYGHPEAEKVIIVMGSAAETCQQTVKHLIHEGDKVGILKVRMFRPWNAETFIKSLPDTVKHVCVLEKTREEGSLGNPLFLDVSVSFSELRPNNLPRITGGIAGLGQKEITPNMVIAAFKNLDSNNDDIKKRFTLGINDDVTFTSLDYELGRSPDYGLGKDTKQCLFWGLGSDGTTGSNKEAIKMISDNTDLYCQGFFAYDSKKSGGITMSHLRFGPEKIHASYQITNADYIACHNSANQFIGKLDILGPIKKNGIFVLNSPWHTIEDLNKHLPPRMKRQIAENDIEFYNIDATKIAMEMGLKGRINTVMQAVFYQVSGVLEPDHAIELLKKTIAKMFSKKGQQVIDQNIQCVDKTKENIVKINYPKEEWLKSIDIEKNIESWDKLLYNKEAPSFIKEIMEPCMSLEGENLPVSKFLEHTGGVFPNGTTRYERRGAAPEIPVWKPENCTQCNYCAIVCPHAVIRPFLADKNELKSAPPEYHSIKAQGPNMGGLHYSIQVASYDCTGCAVCVQSCPDDALFMGDFEKYAEPQLPNFEYGMTLSNKNPIGKYTVKGSQFEQPLLEFHCACAGCGETPYVKLLTQLYGENMIIANASGCSSVWGGTCTTAPYSMNKDTQRGPAWGRSLFEDNAEYGYGMLLAGVGRRKTLAKTLQGYIVDESNKENSDGNVELIKLFKEWIQTFDNFDKNNRICDKIDELELLSKYCKDSNDVRLKTIWDQRTMFRPQQQWLLGGDGWAYDIGSAGLDHVLSKGENINILVLDTEIYSNTGGQSSKSSVSGQVTKFESTGKSRHKKDLGQQAMSYGDIYVASVALGADYQQCVKAFKEAAEYPGTSLIMAYSPCIDWGIDMKNMIDIQKVAVESGYWSLYRYDPRNIAKEKPAFQMDVKKLKKSLSTYINNENRFKRLQREHETRAQQLHDSLSDWSQMRHEKLLRQSMDDLELLDFLKSRLGQSIDDSDKIMILYASETGNAAEFSLQVSRELEKRDIRAKAIALDDYDFDNLSNEKNVIIIAATCGQGEFPNNSKEFFKELSKLNKDNIDLSNTNIAVFGMGDSHYVYFNEVAKQIHNKFNELGANMLLDYGKGDDQDDEKYETAWEEWSDNLFQLMNLPEPKKELLPPSYDIIWDNDNNESDIEYFIPHGAQIINVNKNQLLTPIDYDRDTRHYEFDIQNTGMSYEVGDSLGIYAHNEQTKVDEFCAYYGLNKHHIIQLKDKMDPDERGDLLPEYITIEQLFTQVLDVFGRPKKRFYELLSMVSTSEIEKKELERLLTKDGQIDYKTKYVQETFNHFDLLKAFPSCKPSLEYLIDYIPKIKPRLYSIASSPNESPDNIALCVIKDDWYTPINKHYKYGLCSNYLTKIEPNKTKVVAKVNAGVVQLPNDLSIPMVMAGLGTGLAPLRGMVRDRVWQQQNTGKNLGDMSLYFGARYRSKEFLYEKEWEEFHNKGKGPLKHLRPAFSRDQKEKIYIQDKIIEDGEQITDYLVNQNGYFYACGSSAVNDLKKYISQSIEKYTTMNKEESEQYVTDMQIQGRYCIESW